MAQKQKKKALREHRFLVQVGAFVAIVAGAFRGGFFGESDEITETPETEKTLSETSDVTCVIPDFNNIKAAELKPASASEAGDGNSSDKVTTSDDLVYAAELPSASATSGQTEKSQIKSVKTPDGLTNVTQVLNADHNETNLSYDQAKQLAAENGAAVSPDAKNTVIGTPENKTPDDVKKSVSGFADVQTGPNGDVSSGTYTSSDHARTAIVGEVTTTIGTPVQKSTEKGDQLPAYDVATGKVKDGKTLVSAVVTTPKDGTTTHYATVKGDVAPSVVYDATGKPVQLDDIKVGQTYYSDAEKTTKLIFTKNKLGKIVDETKGFTIPKQIKDDATGQKINNSASLDQANNVIQLTPDKNDQAGTAILGSDKGIDLSQDFDLDASVNLGSHSVEKSGGGATKWVKDTAGKWVQVHTGAEKGGDGISFGFNPIGNADVGHWGNSFGLGYLNHSFGFKLDTYYNNIKDVLASNDSQYNNQKLSEAHGSLPYGPDPLQNKVDGTPQDNMNGHSFGAFIYTDANGMVHTNGETYDGNGGNPYYIDDPSQGHNNGVGQMDIETINGDENKESQLASVISGDAGQTTPWQNIKIHYEAASQTMTVTYQGHTWTQNISEWLKAAGTNVKFMISGSTGYASNLQQVKINALIYTSSPEQAWEETAKLLVTTWTETPVSQQQKIQVNDNKYQVNWQEQAFTDLPEPPITPDTPEPPATPNVPDTPNTPDQPEPPLTPEPPVTPHQTVPPKVPNTPKKPNTPELPKTSVPPLATPVSHTLNHEKGDTSAKVMLPHTGENKEQRVKTTGAILVTVAAGLGMLVFWKKRKKG